MSKLHPAELVEMAHVRPALAHICAIMDRLLLFTDSGGVPTIKRSLTRRKEVIMKLEGGVMVTRTENTRKESGGNL